MSHQTIAAGEFKQRCLKILDEVADTHEAVVITKRGRPVAKLVPLKDDRHREEEILKTLRCGLTILVNETVLMRPLTEEAGWSLDPKD